MAFPRQRAFIRASGSPSQLMPERNEMISASILFNAKLSSSNSSVFAKRFRDTGMALPEKLLQFVPPEYHRMSGMT